VSDGDPKRSVCVERLRFLDFATARGGVADVPNTSWAQKVLNILLCEHFIDETFAFVDFQASFIRGTYSRRILTSMLKHSESINKQLTARLLLIMKSDSHDPAH
jgi:hypothetical protein